MYRIFWLIFIFEKQRKKLQALQEEYKLLLSDIDKNKKIKIKEKYQNEDLWIQELIRIIKFTCSNELMFLKLAVKCE